MHTGFGGQGDFPYVPEHQPGPQGAPAQDAAVVLFLSGHTLLVQQARELHHTLNPNTQSTIIP